jgi:hypothetical protein
MYIKYKDYTGKLAKGDIVLMSAYEYANGGSKLIGIPVTITPYGKEPIEPPADPAELPAELPMAHTPSETELLQAEIADLEARLAKVEAVPIVKTALILK